jgi:hypothetical protein
MANLTTFCDSVNRVRSQHFCGGRLHPSECEECFSITSSELCCAPPRRITQRSSVKSAFSIKGAGNLKPRVAEKAQAIKIGFRAHPIRAKCGVMNMTTSC